jgi:hypothetical protein
MKQLLIVSGLVMSITINAMNDEQGAQPSYLKPAEGATPLVISDEVQGMPERYSLKRKPKASKGWRTAVDHSLEKFHEARWNRDVKALETFMAESEKEARALAALAASKKK